MKRIFALSLSLLLVWPVLAPAAPTEKIALSEVIEALEGPFKVNAPATVAIRDFAAELLQESNILSLNRIQRAQGRVSVLFDHNPSEPLSKTLFHWEYTQPTPQAFISDGVSLFAYLPENKQVIQSDLLTLDPSRPENPISFLTGLGHLSRDFLVTWGEPKEDAEGNFVLNLVPKQESPMLKQLRVVVNRDAVKPSKHQSASGILFPLRSTTVFDPNGNTTIIEFKNVRINRGIPAGEFQFTIPAGVEVIHPSDNGPGR